MSALLLLRTACVLHFGSQVEHTVTNSKLHVW